MTIIIIKRVCIKMQIMWDIKCMIIQITTGTTGMVMNRFQGKFGNHTRETFNTFGTKKQTATLGTSHITGKVL
jgi:hypothetical protein